VNRRAGLRAIGVVTLLIWLCGDSRGQDNPDTPTKSVISSCPGLARRVSDVLWRVTKSPFQKRGRKYCFVGASSSASWSSLTAMTCLPGEGRRVRCSPSSTLPIFDHRKKPGRGLCRRQAAGRCGLSSGAVICDQPGAYSSFLQRKGLKFGIG